MKRFPPGRGGLGRGARRRPGPRPERRGGEALGPPAASSPAGGTAADPERACRANFVIFYAEKIYPGARQSRAICFLPL